MGDGGMGRLCRWGYIAEIMEGELDDGFVKGLLSSGIVVANGRVLFFWKKERGAGM